MENILKKALSEVLTPLYSEELRDAYDTGYKFSPEFENRMRELIRKTDRVIRFRTAYIAAAACAVIAIGSAILIPTLMNNNVQTQPPAETSVTVNTTVPTETGITPVTSDTTDTTAPGSSVTSHDDTSTSENSVTSPDNTTVPDTTSQTDVDVGPIIVTVPGSPDVVVTSDSSVSAVTENSASESQLSADDDDIAPVDEELESEDEIFDDDDDDALVVTPDGDEDDIVSVDVDDDEAVITVDIPVDEEVKIPVNDGDKLGDVVKLIDENFSFENEWANSARYSVKGLINVNNSQSLNFYQAEYGFIQDFVHSLGDAEAVSEGFSSEGISVLELWIDPHKLPVRDMTRNLFNISAWKNYDQFYNKDEWDEETIDDSDDGEDPIIDDDNYTVKVKVYANGIVEVTIEKITEDPATGKYYRYTLSNNRFRVDTERVNTLFGKLDSLYIPDTVKTVGDIADALNITAGNIGQAYASVEYIYDTVMTNAKIGYDYIEELFRSHASDKVTYSSDEYNGEIRITVYTKDSAWIEVYLSTAGKCYVRTWNKAYCFNIKLSDIKDAMNSIAAANNVTIPLFDTLAEYAGAKYLKNLRMADFVVKGKNGKQIITDKDALEKVLDFIKAEFSTAKYLVNKAQFGLLNPSGILIYADGFAHPLVIGEDDVLYFRWFRYTPFKMSEGFTARLQALLESLPSEQPEQGTEVYDDDDDDDVDEIVFNDDDEDYVEDVDD